MMKSASSANSVAGCGSAFPARSTPERKRSSAVRFAPGLGAAVVSVIGAS
jgi:hypothetical protein